MFHASPGAELSRAVITALRVGYVLGGYLPLDEVVGSLTGSVVAGSDATSHEQAQEVSWIDLVATSRRRGATGAILRLPTAGDVRGIHPLPRGYEAPDPILGLATKDRVVVWLESRGVEWRMTEADQPLPGMTSLAEADRALRTATLAALHEWNEAEFLAGDEANQEALARGMRPWARLDWPASDPDVTARAGAAQRAMRLFAATWLAMADDRGITSGQMEQRARVMRELNRAARTALEACCSVSPGR